MSAKNEINKILSAIRESINSQQFIPIETDKVELKDLSNGDNWKELYKTICAFLNTKGGIVIIGIHENKKNNQYTVTGYNENNESKLKDLPSLFEDDRGKSVDLQEYIRVESFEIIDFLNKRLCILYIEKLPEDQKFVFYKGKAYHRLVTGDHQLTNDRILHQKELREELLLARELSTVDDASLDDLDVDKLNDYIQRLNQDIKVETYKADISTSLSFLARKKFIVNNKPTLLGMLVCGKHIEDFVSGRCQVDCYIESIEKIAENKKSYRDNIIPLLERTYSFTISGISTGISVEKGGSRVPEYPDRLIRETINNALAHRDYSVDRFVNVTINPGRHIEIRNPGRFREEQVIRINHDYPIRRIIPVPKPINPRLADVLKYFDRWEGKGWGMSSLTNAALENQIDLPWYLLYSENDIGLYIPKGKILDDEIKGWLRVFSKYILEKTNGQHLSTEQQTVLGYFFKSERYNKQEKYTITLSPDNNHFKVIEDLERWRLVFKHPNSPAYHPIYLVDRTLLRDNFSVELREIFGGAYDDIALEYQSVLNTIYQFNEFSLANEDTNAARVGDYLFFKSHSYISDVKYYNDFKRKIRRIINTLTSREYLIQTKQPRIHYKINMNYSRKPSVFDHH
jgi:ATP-dependent DNA helicase RecG